MHSIARQKQHENFRSRFPTMFYVQRQGRMINPDFPPISCLSRLQDMATSGKTIVGLCQCRKTAFEHVL